MRRKSKEEVKQLPNLSAEFAAQKRAVNLDLLFSGKYGIRIVKSKKYRKPKHKPDYTKE